MATSPSGRKKRAVAALPAPTLFEPVKYGKRFLSDHAGTIVTDPKVALVELVANAHDAGATSVDVTWPSSIGEVFSVRDNGTGMTREQFLDRWSQLVYDRRETQGENVEFPPSVKKPGKRVAFGQNGKCRFAPFCFAEEYEVMTTRDGRTTIGKVKLSPSTDKPFLISAVDGGASVEHGTSISWNADKKGLVEETDGELISSIFLLDPQFSIRLNGKQLDLESLEGITKECIQVGEYGDVNLYVIDSGENKKHNRPGIAWRVNRRLVGDPGWAEFDSHGGYTGGRPEQSKRFCVLLEADIMKDSVKTDWRAFKDNPKTVALKAAVHDQVAKSLRLLTKDTNQRRKRIAIESNESIVRDLPPLSQGTVGRFVDEVQDKCHSLTQKELNTVVRVLAVMEHARSGYGLLQQLSEFSPTEIDTWYTIMKNWDANHAELVLNEVERRMAIIKRLEAMMADRKTDEVHEILPLFARGIWMFGPQYESVDFRANQTLATVIRELAGGTDAELQAKRPDVVVTPTGAIMPFSLDAYTPDGEVSGLDKVLIVELKKSGFAITDKEVQQAVGYVRGLRKGKHVGPNTTITAYVLGWELGEDADEFLIGNQDPKPQVLPKTYGLIVRMAHNRIFKLAERIRQMDAIPAPDLDIIETLRNTTATIVT